MAEDGVLIVEIGYQQLPAIIELIDIYLPDSNYHVIKDLNNIARVISISI